MIRYTTYLCGPAEKDFIKERLDKIALQGRVNKEDIELITREIDRYLSIVSKEVTELCQTQKT